MKSRKAQIEERIRNKELQFLTVQCKHSYIAGAEWADAHPEFHTTSEARRKWLESEIKLKEYKKLCNEMYVVLCWTKTKLKHMGYEVSGDIDVVFDKYEAMKNDSSQ